MQDFSFTVHIFKEGDTYVAYVPSLDVSSCGVTDEEARQNIRDAVRGFLAASADQGTLEEILQEAGYELDGRAWRAPEFVSVDQLTTGIPITMAALRPVHYQELVRVFERDGFFYNRQEGDHLMRTAGVSHERYFDLLKQS